MLYLTRNLHERIFIGDDIIIEYCMLNGQQIRLGIQAPKEVIVLREEVWERIQAEKYVKGDSTGVYSKAVP